MSIDNLELAKSAGKASEKFLEVIMNFLQDPLEAVIVEGHKELINRAINGKKSIQKCLISFVDIKN